jgi:prepilin-type N-terminal cleavage/methylation domain-containing protein
MWEVLKTRSGERGFSLIELMFALVALSVIALAGFTVISTSQRAAVTNDQTVQIQQNARIALDFVSRDIRMAGYGSPAAPGAVLPVGNCPAIINPSNSAVGPDGISIVTVGQLIGTLALPAPQIPGTLITLSSIAGLSVADVITLDGVFTATVTAINAGTKVVTLSTAIQAPQQFGLTTQVVQLQCVTYSVNTATKQLLRNGVAVADGIADLQLAYGVDANGDGIIDDQAGGLANTVDCLDLIPNTLAQVAGMTNSAGCTLPPGTVAGPPADSSTIRLVRISIVGEAVRADPTWTSSSALLVEDHSIANGPGLRRRVLTRTISLRNNS